MGIHKILQCCAQPTIHGCILELDAQCAALQTWTGGSHGLPLKQRFRLGPVPQIQESCSSLSIHHVWLLQLSLTFPVVLQSIARTEYLERITAYQSAELTKMQREVYHLQSLLSSHGVDLALVRSSCKHAALLLWMSHAIVLWLT